jgi:hypothetical protein
VAFKSYLKPEGSIVAGLAVMGAVFAIYQLDLGSSAEVAMTDANHPIVESSRKKAGYKAAVLVAGIGLIAKDANIIILGSATIIAMEISYRHAIMLHPASGRMVPVGSEAYAPAGDITSAAYEQESMSSYS